MSPESSPVGPDRKENAPPTPPTALPQVEAQVGHVREAVLAAVDPDPQAATRRQIESPPQTPKRTMELFRGAFPHWVQIGHGGNSAVFQHEKWPFGQVTKVPREPKSMQEVIQEHNELLRHFAALRATLARPEYLGPKEAKEVVVKVRSDRISLGEKSLWVLRQEYVPEVESPHGQVRGGYAECSSSITLQEGSNALPPAPPGDANLYQEITEILVQDRDPNRFTTDKFIETQGSDDIRALLQSCREHPAQAAYVLRLLQGLLAHAIKMGDCFDTAGENNFIVFPRSDDREDWTARLIDPFMEANVRPLALEGLRRLRDGKIPDDTRVVVALLNWLNSERTLRGLVLALGGTPIPPALPDDLKEARIDFCPFALRCWEFMRKAQRHTRH